MDRFRLFRDMSVRRMVALSCAGTVISVAVAFGLVLWRFPADLVAGGTGIPVTAVGSLYLENVCAVVGQQLRAVRPGYIVSEVQNSDI